MSETPPEHYVAYPRRRRRRPDPEPDRLEALGDGYFGLSNAFGLNFLLVVAGAVLVNAHLLSPIAFALLVSPVMAFFNYPSAKKVAYGLKWSPAWAVAAAILMGLNACIAGILGYVMMQAIAGGGLEVYGVPRRWHGFTRKDVNARVEELRMPTAERVLTGP